MLSKSSSFLVLGVSLLACGSSSGSSSDGGTKIPDTGLTRVDSSGGLIDSGAEASSDLLTQRGDNSRTGVNSNEKVLTQANVGSSVFGKLTSFAVDGQLYAQPLYVSGYPIGGKPTNLLVAATANNSVYAFNTDTGASVWSAPTKLGPPVPASAANGTNAFPPPAVIGVTGTPVIDRVNGLLYVVNMDYAGSVVAHYFHVLDLATGAEKKGSPLVINPSVAGSGDDASTLLFGPSHELNRAGLLLLDGIVYVAFASQFDQLPYHGFILGYQYDTALGTITQKLAWSTSPDGQAGGIWQGGQGLTVDAEKNIYVMTGNGTVNVQNGGTSYGEAFVKLSANLTVEDWFIPSTFSNLNEDDVDVGSGGPILIPGASSYVVGAGKDGILRVIDTKQMGHLVADDTQIVQEIPFTNWFFGSPLAWEDPGGTTRLYVWGEDVPLKEFVLSGKLFGTTPIAVSTAITPGGYDPVGVLSLSSNGDASTSAILWASMPTDDPNGMSVPAILYAFDPVTLEDLWDSSMVTRDSVGAFAKWVPPTIADGKVFMATNSNEVVVYGLRPDAG
jgi:hypothetical protein